MVFTPLLASTCVGTLEFRSVVEPVSRIQSALATRPGSYFFLASCTGIDTGRHEVHCTAADGDGLPANPYNFKVSYDKLVIASGSEPLTFGIKGVAENAIFLREVSHAQEIRRKLLTNLMLSENPGLSEEEKKRLLHCVVVGGGPTGVEFSGELSDFITRDVRERYAHVKDYVKVTLIEANEILSSFDVGLRQYATDHLSKYGVNLVRGVVKEVKPREIELSDGPRASPGGRIGVDEWLRVPSVEDVFALGDCAGFLEGTGRAVLPALAQVAEREGRYLARVMSRIAAQDGGRAGRAVGSAELGEPFVYKHIGSMASVGRYKALVDLRENKDARGVSMAGFVSWLMWRSAYLTRVFGASWVVCQPGFGRLRDFVRSLPFPKSPGGRIGVDEWLRVPSVEDVFALGDCAGFLEGTGRAVLPALAQVAEREGRYLARVMSRIAAQDGGRAGRAVGSAELGEPFVYKHIGSMASVGRYKALVDLRENKDARGVSMAGFVSWLMWRSAYLTRVLVKC
ncbi:hypothetical protein OsJ_24758 [Oryza sativa Japonica Group]|uniref:FAD/NAD(P)-binding domain-containing protein n=1 Tax=Oryza sativa subsp. japonica TaxID=39947 RepID=B9FXY2_ORYSJ|nr:hypothetical protein OsJ_24758 [Oryza sativa Japonica Group]